jgi:hypothetical protein
MQSHLVSITYEVELEPGEKLTLPQVLVDSIGAGRWVLTLQPLYAATSSASIRDHSSFLNSYAPEDEGLYDDYPTR